MGRRVPDRCTLYRREARRVSAIVRRRAAARGTWMKQLRHHNHKELPSPPVPGRLDSGIRAAVARLQAGGIETFESCEGGAIRTRIPGTDSRLSRDARGGLARGCNLSRVRAAGSIVAASLERAGRKRTDRPPLGAHLPRPHPSLAQPDALLAALLASRT